MASSTPTAMIKNRIELLDGLIHNLRDEALEMGECPERSELTDKFHKAEDAKRELEKLLKHVEEEGGKLTTLKIERQNSTLETTNQPFVSRTYEESPYARRQWEYWLREQRLRRMAEFDSVIYGGDKEFDEISEAIAELSKIRNKLEPKEFRDQLIALNKEEAKWYRLANNRTRRMGKGRRGLKKRIRELNAYHSYSNPVSYSEEGEAHMLLHWVLHLTNYGVDPEGLHRFLGSIYIDWLRSYRQLEQNWLLDRKKKLELEKELRDLELPRLVSKRNKGLKWPLKDDNVDKFMDSVRYHQKTRWTIKGVSVYPKKPVVTMHPYVDEKHRDTLEVGDYTRVSTNQSIKRKWITELTPREEWELGCVEGYDDDYVKNCAYFWAKHVRNNHPKYRDPQTRAEKNAKRIEAIKKAYPDYF